MKEYVLNYYSSFKCTAEKCKHTCCAGWEINIDEQSLDNYKRESSEFKTTLISGINLKKSRFKVNKQKRCAFLNDKNLCDLIINIGEKSLCQVCRDHPRFRSFYGATTEMGLGFCCEEAVRIILSYTGKISPVLCFNDKKEEQLDFNEKNLLEFREHLLNVIQDRNKNINDRIEEVLSICNAKINQKDLAKTIKKFIAFERVDKNWTKWLKSISKTQFELNTKDSLSLIAEQFLVNSFYRHLLGAEDTIDVRSRAVACVITWWIIKNIAKKETNGKQDFSVLIDVVRAYSTEVEYSEKNLNKLFNYAYKFISL